MKKKMVVVLLTAAMSMSLLAGCGGNSGSSDAKSDAKTEDTKEDSDQVAADKVAKLIDDIYVQERTDKTDEQCKEAKEAWDALTDAQKELVEGENADPDYFGRDTGDASKDDPLNQDEIGENELLVVSFGTSFNDSRAKDIGGIEKALQAANPDWSVRRAFTAQIIINHVQARDDEKIDNMEQALERAVDNGVKNLVVQPTHLMHGAEYDELSETVENYKDKFEIAGDITKIDEKDIPEFDICLAGFPCQAFSLAGKRMGFDDDYKGMCRGTLFQDVVRICEYHKPKVIFCENVKGLTIHDRGRTFKVIKSAFEQIGYTVYDKVLNSKDFGVPQNRERIYIVAFRKDINSENFEFPVGNKPDTCIRDIMEEQEVSVKYYLSTTYIETLKRHKARHAAKGNGFGYEIRDLDGKAGAIVCGGMGRERNLIIDNRLTNFVPVTHIKGEVNREGIRKMTPREWARLQGFPDDFKLELADTHLYKQFGNSVTVNVIEAIADKIKVILDADEKAKSVVETVNIRQTKKERAVG